MGPSCQIRLASASPAAPNSAIDASTPANSAKVQTHSAKTGHFQRFSPNGSALWRPHPLRLAAAQPQVGGNCTTRGSDTPATRRKKASCSAKPPPQPPEVRRIAYKAWHSTGWREKVRPTPPLQWHFREKTRPASAKTPNLGCCERAGRTFSRFHDLTATQGELFRACRRRPSGALPISDPAPLAWRAPASTKDQAAVPVGGRARPQCPQTTATPSPSKFRMQFPRDTDRCTLKNRGISTIRFQYLKYTQGNCMRNCWMTEGPGRSARGRRRGLARQ